MFEVVFEKSVDVDFIVENVYEDFEFEGSGVYKFEYEEGGVVCGVIKMSDDNRVMVESVEELLKKEMELLDEYGIEYGEKEIEKMKEFVYCGWNDVYDIGEENGWCIGRGEECGDELYYVK